jgi:hypothetical protein
LLLTQLLVAGQDLRNLILEVFSSKTTPGPYASDMEGSENVRPPINVATDANDLIIDNIIYLNY